MMTKIPFSIALFLLITFCSCEKSNDSPSTPTSRKTKTEILTHKPWIMQEAYHMEANVVNSYNRGANNNTINYDIEVLTLKIDNTGTLNDIFGKTYPVSWSFSNAEQTKMQLTIHFPSANALHNYNMVQISDSSWSVVFNRINPETGNMVLASWKRVWKP
jgi:hypothetical protein